MAKKRKATPTSQLGLVLETRLDRQVRSRLESEAKKRGELLKSILRGYVQHPVFAHEEDRTRQGALQHNIVPGGIASDAGFVLAKRPRHRLVIQESVGLDARGAARVIMYSYQFYGADGAAKLFRFEYHPLLAQESESWSARHHLHVDLSPESVGVGRIHFPVAEFLAEPVAPDQVLPRVLAWSNEELARLG